MPAKDSNPGMFAGTRLVGCRLCRCDVSDCCDTNTRAGGYGEAKIDKQLTDLGVTNVVIPRKGKPSQARRADEHRKAFRRTIKWRTGCEGRIGTLKRGYGWDRTRLDSFQGAKTWTGQGSSPTTSSRSPP